MLPNTKMFAVLLKQMFLHSDLAPHYLKESNISLLFNNTSIGLYYSLNKIYKFGIEAT